MAERTVCQCDWDDAHAIDGLLDIHADDPTPGWAKLLSPAGHLVWTGLTAPALCWAPSADGDPKPCCV